MEAIVKPLAKLFVVVMSLLTLLCVPAVQAEDKTGTVNNYEKYTSDGNFFAAMVPSGWEKDEDITLGRSAKEYGVILIGPRGSQGTPAMISVLYYGDGKIPHDSLKSADVFITRNSRPHRLPLLPDEEYSNIGEIALAGRKARTFTSKTYVTAFQSKKILISKKFVVLPATVGFYLLQYEAPPDLAKKHESVFDQVINSFNPHVP